MAFVIIPGFGTVDPPLLRALSNAGHEVLVAPTASEAAHALSHVRTSAGAIQLAMLPIAGLETSGALLELLSLLESGPHHLFLLSPPLPGPKVATILRSLGGQATSWDGWAEMFAGASKLSPQQTVLLKAALEGKSGKEAADAIHCAPGTARRYMDRLYAKTGCHTQRELVVCFARFVTEAIAGAVT